MSILVQKNELEARGPVKPSWTVDDAVRQYGVGRWGQGYFGVNSSGHVSV